MRDYFISYNKADRQWAEWVAWSLEESGQSVYIQEWDFRPGENFVLKMQEAAAGTKKTIAVLSNDYLQAEYTHPEWAAAFARDPRGEERTLVPIRVRDCQPRGLLASISYIDLVGVSDEEEAREKLLRGLAERAKPHEPPPFPSRGESIAGSERVVPQAVEYPGTPGNDQGADTPQSEIPWNVPEGVSFFTGREDVLERVRANLMSSGAAALAQRQVISGLGGIGKTQTAIEYAKRHRGEYQAVLWAVAESRESLISDFVNIASVLKLPEMNAQDHNLVVRAVKRWLDVNGSWLLILDNADEPKLVEEFMPAHSKGHILLTSRAQVFDSLGILNPVELEEMSADDAREFLMKRTGRLELDSDEADAVKQLTQELDYLPLALDQAGAYIKELRSSFQDYLLSYRQRGLDLLEKGSPTSKYRKSVKTTWSLNFQQVEESSPAAADLLRVSAFLNPDRIPAELIGRSATELGPELSQALLNVEVDPLALDEVLGPLIRYSLIHRDRRSRTYDIHRLVQAVLKDAMPDETERLWAERTVKAVASAFPDVDAIAISQWERIERLLPHAQACAELINKWELELPEAAHLLNLAGRYLHLRARLDEAGSFYAKSLAIREKILGPNHLNVATSLHNQAWLYFDLNKYAEAEPLNLRSLAIREESAGPEHPVVASSYLRLGHLYKEQGRYAEAKRAYERSLEIAQGALSPEHPYVAASLQELGRLNFIFGKVEEAEPLTLKALEIRQKALGLEHYDVASSLNYLADIYTRQQKFTEAEELYKRAIAIFEKSFGADYPSLTLLLKDLAFFYLEQAKYTEAEPLLTRALSISEASLGREHLYVGVALRGLALLRHQQLRYAEAEESYLRALSIREKTSGPNHPSYAHILNDLGRLYSDQRKYLKAEPLFRKAVTILKKAFGPESSNVVPVMLDHAALLWKMNRKDEAQKLRAQAEKIQAKQAKKRKK